MAFAFAASAYPAIFTSTLLSSTYLHMHDFRMLPFTQQTDGHIQDQSHTPDETEEVDIIQPQ